MFWKVNEKLGAYFVRMFWKVNEKLGAYFLPMFWTVWKIRSIFCDNVLKSKWKIRSIFLQCNKFQINFCSSASLTSPQNGLSWEICLSSWLNGFIRNITEHQKERSEWNLFVENSRSMCKVKSQKFPFETSVPYKMKEVD